MHHPYRQVAAGPRQLATSPRFPSPRIEVSNVQSYLNKMFQLRRATEPEAAALAAQFSTAADPARLMADFHAVHPPQGSLRHLGQLNELMEVLGWMISIEEEPRDAVPERSLIALVKG
jgi:hypothetical protein